MADGSTCSDCHHTYSIVVQSVFAKCLRQILEVKGFYNRSKKIHKTSDSCVALPIHDHAAKQLPSSGSIDGIDYSIQIIEILTSKMSPALKLVKACKNMLESAGDQWSEQCERDVSKTWEKHGNLILLSNTCFKLDIWKKYGITLWETVSHCLKAERVAIKSTISTNGFRQPKVDIVLGECGIVEHTDNGVRYYYDVTKCMFSAGNITEKLRIAKMNCQGETVVDLYAGIGYFTLPYLVHAEADLVHACEWNPDAVMALKAGLEANGVSDRCIIHRGDNREVCPKGVADRVNLGLIPTSKDGWPVACAALKPETGGILHIHGNVSSLHPQCDTSIPATELDYKVSHSKSSFMDPVTCNSSQETVHPTIADSTINSTLGDCSLDSNKKCSSCKTNSCIDKTLCGSTVTVDRINISGKVSHCLDLSKVQKQVIWDVWAEEVSGSIQLILETVHGGCWSTNILHIENVKSYAPHINHLVLDLQCIPK